MTNGEVTEDVEKAQATPPVEKSDGNQAGRHPDSNSMTTSSSMWERTKEKAEDVLWWIKWGILMLTAAPVIVAYLLWEVWVVWIFPQWTKIFVISCVFAVVMDPLFLYIPIIKEDSKCVGMDKNLTEAAFALRTLTDFSYLVDIIVQYHNYQTIWHSYIPIDILAILPLPQAVIMIFFSELGDRTRKLMNFLAMTQYVPRVLRIYFSCKEFKESYKEHIVPWMKGVLNFFLYILSSHVLGAFWYFFAIQRMASCWKFACRTENECQYSSSFGCYDDEFRNTTFLNDLCPTNPPNATLFNFGIFVDILESGLAGSTDHPQKFANCFWWGLRNLSSLGSNLQPSINTWENLFAAIVSLIGLLLFLYLVGNLQMYMQSHAQEEAARKQKERERQEEEDRRKNEIEQKLERKVEEWLDENAMIIRKSDKEDVKSQIMMRMVKHVLGQKGDVDGKNILSILPSDLQNHIKERVADLQNYIEERVAWKMLKEKVPKLRSMHEEVLQAMCRRLRPMRYTRSSYIIREDKPLEMMFFITHGEVEITSGKDGFTILKPGDFYGDKLLDWVKAPVFPSLLPRSTGYAWARGDVEVRILTARDLCDVATLYGEHFKESDFPPPRGSDVNPEDLGIANLPHSALARKSAAKEKSTQQE